MGRARAKSRGLERGAVRGARRRASALGSAAVLAAAPPSRRAQVASNRRQPSPARPRGRIDYGPSARTRAGARDARVARSAGEWIAERRQAGKASLGAAPWMACRAAALAVGPAYHVPPLSRGSRPGSSSLPANAVWLLPLAPVAHATMRDRLRRVHRRSGILGRTSRWPQRRRAPRRSAAMCSSAAGPRLEKTSP